MEEIIDQNGNKKVVLSQYTIYGKEYFIISSKEVFTKENGNFIKFDINETGKIPSKDANLERTRYLLREMINETRSLDVIER